MLNAGSGLPEMIVLAGGLGTRLRGAVAPGLPKVLAPVHGRPFLDYLLAWLAEQGIARAVFALGHGAESVAARLRACRAACPVALDWRIEPAPLGTAGGLAHALAGETGRPRFVMNGDTLADLSLRRFHDGFAGRTGAELGMAAIAVADGARYGRLELDAADRVVRLREKAPPDRPADPALINAGIYLMREGLLARIAALGSGSLEQDVLARLPPGAIWAFRGVHRFIDIGTPASLAEAERLLVPLPASGFAGPVWASSAAG